MTERDWRPVYERPGERKRVRWKGTLMDGLPLDTPPEQRAFDVLGWYGPDGAKEVDGEPVDGWGPPYSPARPCRRFEAWAVCPGDKPRG